DLTDDEERGGASESDEEDTGVDVEIDRQLDQSLETKSKQHNLTTVNVRNIIHEVITNEHVVAMMKAAINETEAVPPFEPKMTRSKFKEVVEKGVVSVFTVPSSIFFFSLLLCKAPQFVDIPLAEEDSSDEEYHPDEEEEDETAEDTFQESDMESTASSPRGSRLNRVEEESCSPWQVTAAYYPTTASSPYQPLSESEDEAGLMAYRTRSKRPLRDVPLGQLEAELRAPDITPDMYDSSSAHEDREWTDWLRGLMSSDVDNEEECDDEDDPEYNFLADNDEPDLEDYRDDKACLSFDSAVSLTCLSLTYLSLSPVSLSPVSLSPTCLSHLSLSHLSLSHLPVSLTCLSHLSVSQHVQLLTQVHLLSSPVSKLQSEAETSRQFLFELNLLAQRGELMRSAERPGFCSAFRASNLQGALQLLEELRQAPISYRPQLRLPDARVRCFPVMPSELAWIFATRPTFLYPELLPCVSLDPDLYCPRRTAAFTAAEDCLLVLGLRNMEGACDPPKLVSQFLLRKTLVQVRRRILQCCRPGFPDNIVKVALTDHTVFRL
uniref:Si:dkey-27c15.3 n=1 Tax=Stegastes partitus TaxID=144197 RepID=A0A3B4ZHM6_9TELE